MTVGRGTAASSHVSECMTLWPRATMRPIMEILASVLNCSLLSHKYKTLNPDISKEALSVTVTSTADLSILIDYFNKYPLLGTKGKDFKDWVFIFPFLGRMVYL